MVVTKLLKHQGSFIQAPYVYDSLRFYFLIAGYASGKSTCLNYALLYAVTHLSGLKDNEGKMPKILVGGISLTFMRKTITGALEQILKNTKTEYYYDKAHNIIEVAGCQLLLVPINDESNIFGYDVCCFRGDTLIATEHGEKPISELKVGERVWTTQGLKRIKHVWNRGTKDCVRVKVDGKEIICTPDHKFIDAFHNEIEAKYLTKSTPLFRFNYKYKDANITHIDEDVSDIIGQYEVYDIEVEDAHEFFAEGIRVHNCAFIDELDELPTYESMGIVKSVNDRCRQRVKGFRAPFIAVTTTSQGLKGTYQTVMEFKKAGIPYMIVRGRTKDNIYLPKEYVDSMYKIYNEKETQCLLEGKFISIDSGLVFPDYNPEVNKLDADLYDYVRINGLPVYIGQDFNGFGNYAQAYSLFTFSDGKVAIVMIKDYKLPDMRRAPETFRYDFPHSEIVWIPDMTYQNNFSQFKHELKVNNIKIAYRKSNPLVNDRNFACNKLMHVECFYLCPMCKMSDTALMTHQKDPKTGLPMKGGDGAPDHLNDCMGYVVHYLLSWKKELKCLYDVTLGYKYKKRREQGEEDEKNLEVGGYIMEADRIKDSPVSGLGEKRTKQKNVDMAIIE